MSLQSKGKQRKSPMKPDEDVLLSISSIFRKLLGFLHMAFTVHLDNLAYFVRQQRI